MNIKILAPSLAVSLLFLGAGCAPQISSSQPQPVSVSSQPTSPSQPEKGSVPGQPPSNLFDPLKVKVGDMIGGLKLVSLKPLFDRNPLSSENVQAEFSGQVTVTGKYDYSSNEFFGADEVCLEVSDKAEMAKIPQVAGAQNTEVFFCFSNFEKAKAAFGPKYGSGQATVIIQHYIVQYAPAEVRDQAEFVSVVSKK